MSAKKATARKAISTKTRFEVFKRDSFKCQYCGAASPEVVLNVDHIKSVAQGGDNDLLNLITSCFGCNNGKRATALGDSTAVSRQKAQLDELQARREQLDMLIQWRSGLSTIQEDAADVAAKHWAKCSCGWTLNEGGMAEMRKLLRKYPLQEILEAIDASADQYLKVSEDGNGTPESVHKTWVYVEKIANMRKVHEKNPHLRDLLYIRAIVRNEAGLPTWRSHLALQRLKDAHEAGVSLDKLRTMAMLARSWTSWSDQMFDAVSEVTP